MVESDQLTQTHFAVSNEGDAFLTSGFNALKDGSGHLCFVQQYDWKHRRVVYETAGDFHDLNTMSFSVDDKFVCVVYSHNNLRIYERDITKPIFSKQLTEVGNVIDALILKDGRVLLFYTEGNWWWYEHRGNEKENPIEGIAYRIALFDTKNEVLEILHEYSASAEVEMDEEGAVKQALLPLFAIDSNGETVMFFERGKLKKLTVKTKSVTEMPFNYGEPDYITFASNTDVLIVVYFEECLRYNVTEGCEIGIYRYDGLNYQIRGKQSALKLLMFDEELKTYERNIITDSLSAKYQYCKHTITNVFTDSDAKELIVTFDNDSLWIIDEQSGALLETMCYGEPDAKSCLSLYSASSGRMIFLFENESYEYIKCYNIKTGKSERAYFEFVDNHKIKSVFMPKTEDCLFCIYEESVEVINLTSLELTEIFRAEEGSAIQAAYYCAADNIVKIVIAYVLLPNEPERKPIIYEISIGKIGVCLDVSWYELPYLEERISQQMSAFYQEVFTPPQTAGSVSKLNHKYFINSGVFLGYDEICGIDINAGLCIKKHFFEGNDVVRIANATLNPSVVNYVISDLPVILTQMSYDGNNYNDDMPPTYQLLDVSDDGQTIAALLKDGLIVFQFYDGQFREVCRYSSSFNNLFEESGVSGARIGKDGFVYYWLGANKLYRLDIREGVNKSYENFTPGLSVMGCNFRGSDMSTVTRFTLVLHGGVTD